MTKQNEKTWKEVGVLFSGRFFALLRTKERIPSRLVRVGVLWPAPTCWGVAIPCPTTRLLRLTKVSLAMTQHTS